MELLYNKTVHISSGFGKFAREFSLPMYFSHIRLSDSPENQKARTPICGIRAFFFY